MGMADILLLGILELAALLGVAVFILYRKRKQLQAELHALTLASKTPQTFESIASGYLPYLEKQILESREQLESSEGTDEPDNASVEALNYRLSLLEAEKKVTERCNDYPESRWDHVTELFTPPETPEPEPEPDESPEEQPEDGNALDKAQARIKSLEKFRDNFFAMKKQLQALEASRDKLTEQLEALLPEAERSEELKALLDNLNAQHERLQDEMAQLESQSDELTKSASTNSSNTESPESDSISELSNQIETQKRKMSELHHLVDDLQLEAEKAEALQAQLDQFDLSTRDMNMCIQVLEEENQFLQEQIKSLLQMSEDESVYDSNDSELQEKLESMQAELDDKNQQLVALEEKYATMEQEYLTLYEEANS